MSADEDRWWCRPTAHAVDHEQGKFWLRHDFTAELFRSVPAGQIGAQFEEIARGRAHSEGLILGEPFDWDVRYWDLQDGRVPAALAEEADGCQVVGTWLIAGYIPSVTAAATQEDQ